MSTYKELVFLVLDELKIKIDDSHFTPEHIVAILNKYRAAIIKQKYGGQIKRPIPLNCYQTLNVEMNPTSKVSAFPLPTLIDINGLELSTDIDAVNVLNTFKITLVHPSRFKFLGHNRFLSTILYGTIWFDQHFKVLYSGTIPSTFMISALLENPLDIIHFNELTIDDPLDLEFPLDQASIAELTAFTLKELADIRVFPFKDKNDSKEDNLTGGKE